MRLEDCRGMKVGDAALFLEGRAPIQLAFHHHAEQAEWHTINSMLGFAGNSTDGVANEHIAVVEWWRTVESLVALLHLVARRESEAGMRPDQPRLPENRRETFGEKWSSMSRWFSGGQDSPPSTVTRLVNELRDFRNSFEHSSRSSVIDIKYSRLGPEPAKANLADVMEALAICALACDFARYVLRGLDLMPSVLVPSRPRVFYAPLDEIAAELLFPTYLDLVAKAGLTTDICLYPAPRRLDGASELILTPAIKAVPDISDTRLDEPEDLWPIFERFAETRNDMPGDGQFALPNYAMRDR